MSINKIQNIVKDVITKEEIIFKGNKITIDTVEKVFTIPKIINTDIGFQLMFGTKSPGEATPTKPSTRLLRYTPVA
tara:strand:+ start:915 stop:1142 length:228 start_codon:yes stop_codon:yes gene_type:complete